MASSALPKFLAQGPPLHHLSIIGVTVRCLRLLQQAVGTFTTQPNPSSLLSISSFAIGIRGEFNVGDWNMLFSAMPRSLNTFELRLPSRFHFHPETPIDFQIPANLLQELTNFHLCCDWEEGFLLSVLQNCVNVRVLCLDLLGTSLWNRGQSEELRSLFEAGTVT